MLTCATCGNAEPEGAQFCGSCGAAFVPPASLTCANCGNREPEGSQFCGECGASFTLVEPVLVHAAATETVAVESQPVPPPVGGRRRGRWIALGVALALLAAGSAAAGLLALTDGDGSSQASPTEDSPLVDLFGSDSDSESEYEPPAASSFADSVGPRLSDLALSQRAVNDRVRSLRPGAESFATLRQAGDKLAVNVARTQGFVDALAPTGSADTATLALLLGALVSHRAYAAAIAGLPDRPRSLTAAYAQGMLTRAEEVQLAYTALADAEPALPSIAISSGDHARFQALVPTPKPTLATRRVIDLDPLLVGVRPDDPPGQGRCFGAYTARASLRVSGVVHRSGFVQCGDDANGDPTRTSGVYRFSGRTFPAGSRPVRLTARAVIDESSSSSQRGTSVTWTVFYDGAPICSTTVVWSGSRPAQRTLDCKFRSASRGLDLQRLRVQQVAFPASSGALWAGLLHPTIVVEVPR